MTTLFVKELQTLHLHTTAAILSPAEAIAHAAPVGMLHSAGLVPANDREQLSHQLILDQGIADESD
jgi:hypothetical protein